TYREEDEVWWVHQLDDGQRRRLMEVRDRGGWKVTMLDPADDVPTFGQLGRGITFRQQPYQLARRGDARVSTDGEVTTKAGLLQYATYQGPGGATLNLEDRDGERRAFSGANIEGTGLMLMPGRPPEDDPFDAV